MVAEETVEPPAAEELEAPPVTVQGDRTEEQPKQQEQPEQPKKTMAGEPTVLQMAWFGKQVPSIWDFFAGVRSSSSRSTCTPVPTRLPLLPRLPRCEECQSVLDNGRCVDYDCCATRKSR